MRLTHHYKARVTAKLEFEMIARTMEVPTVMPRNPCCVAGMSWPVLLQYYKELGRALQRMRNGLCEN